MKTKNSVPICLRSKVQLTGTDMWENLFSPLGARETSFPYIGKMTLIETVRWFPGIWRVEAGWRVTSVPSTLFLRNLESVGSARALFMIHSRHQPSSMTISGACEHIFLPLSLCKCSAGLPSTSRLDDICLSLLFTGFDEKVLFLFRSFSKQKLCLYFGSLSCVVEKSAPVWYISRRVFSVYMIVIAASLYQMEKDISGCWRSEWSFSTKIFRFYSDESWLIKHKLMLLRIFHRSSYRQSFDLDCHFENISENCDDNKIHRNGPAVVSVGIAFG